MKKRGVKKIVLEIFISDLSEGLMIFHLEFFYGEVNKSLKALDHLFIR